MLVNILYKKRIFYNNQVFVLIFVTRFQGSPGILTRKGPPVLILCATTADTISGTSKDVREITNIIIFRVSFAEKLFVKAIPILFDIIPQLFHVLPFENHLFHKQIVMIIDCYIIKCKNTLISLENSILTSVILYAGHNVYQKNALRHNCPHYYSCVFKTFIKFQFRNKNVFI